MGQTLQEACLSPASALSMYVPAGQRKGTSSSTLLPKQHRTCFPLHCTPLTAPPHCSGSPCGAQEGAFESPQAHPVPLQIPMTVLYRGDV